MKRKNNFTGKFMSKQSPKQTHDESNKKQNQPVQQEQVQEETAVPVNFHTLKRAYTEPKPLSPAQVNLLQRTIGNQALGRLTIQRKMTLGPVGDKYEQEADAVAKQVVSKLHANPTQTSSAKNVQRQEEEDELQMKPLPVISSLQRQEEEELQMKPVQRQEDEELQAKGDPMLAGGELSGDVESSVQRAKSGGQPMSDNIRGPMEQAFNVDFSGVKVHTDSQADTLNRSLSARAFTSGQDVFFRQGEYNPSISGGQELLAHELTHVVQQGGSSPVTQRSLIQRSLTDRSKRAFEETEKQNSNFSDGKNLVDGETDISGSSTMKDNVTADEQKKINNLRGSGFHSKSPEPEKRLKDYIRSYLLWEFAKRTSQLTLDKVKDPTASKPESSKNLNSKYDKKRKFYLTKNLQKQDQYKGLINKGVAAPETRTFLEYHGVAGGIPLSSDDKKKEQAKGPRIDVRSTYIAGEKFGMRLRAHLFIIYISEDATPYYFRGGPGGGDLTVANWGKYTPGTVDYDPSAPSTTVLSGEAAKDKLDALIEAASIIDGMSVPYRSQVGTKNGENCNSVAWTILDRAGVPKNKPFGVHPGWGHALGAITEGKEDAVPDKESDSGDLLPLPGDAKQSYEVFVDREQTEKTGDSVVGGTEVEYLSRTNDLLRIKYDGGKKIGFINVSVYEEQQIREAKRRADQAVEQKNAEALVDKWYEQLSEDEKFTYKVNDWMLNEVADNLGISLMDLKLRLMELNE